ncbi:MAG: ankyrin repeat domain-containing protein, partial [Gallionella sp.]|nr:ankyrin repeat domain-containing protein [Gallionella sp.]
MKVSPRYFLVFLAVVNVAMVSGCAAPYTPLCAAVNKGDVEKVRAIVDGGADINYNRCDNKFADIPASALAMAITNSENSLAITKLLIEKGAHVNEYDWLGRFYLNIAAQEGNVELVKLLISSGADVNNIDNSGNTPLFYAKQTNKNIRANYFPNLTEAAKKRYRDIEKILVANGAKIPSDAEKQQHVAQIEQHVAQLQQQRLDASFEQKRRDKAESREFWKGAATLATGVAVGKATSGYSPDQQTRMMKSSMKAVDSGDTSELTETTNQVKAEQAQSHKAKMQAIEAQKERDRAAAQRAQEDERNNQAQRKLQQSQAQPRN